MKLLVALLVVISSIVVAREERPEKHNGLAALLAEQGGFVPLGPRIVGGVVTPIEDVPYVVSLQRFSAHRCGGVIISDSRILNAAHCTWLIAASTLSVRAGSSTSQSGGQLIQVERIVNHPSYNPATLNNDISILHLSSPLNTLPVGVAAIGMPAQNAGVAAGTNARVSGWGAISEGGPGSPTLQAVIVPVVSNAVCDAAYGGGITDGMICAGFPEGGRDACQGDSGGPLTAGGQVIGIVSWGQLCARPNFYGVYARVAFYRNWINAN